MKNIVRVFVMSLAATGAFASTHIDNSRNVVVHAKLTAMPIPSCPPDGSTSCGICSFGGCSHPSGK